MVFRNYEVRFFAASRSHLQSKERDYGIEQESHAGNPRRHCRGSAVAAMVKTGVAASEGPVISPGQNGHFAQQYGEFGWKPHKLDPEECAKIAYEGYWYKGYACGYGAFYSIIGVLGEKYGAPYNTFPFTMLEANKGGISDWGTICGALYGAAAAYALFWGRKERDPMVTELYRWYEQTALPIYQPGDMAQGVKGDIPSNPSGSVLCHISVSKWCYNTKLPASGKERSERCRPHHGRRVAQGR